MNIEWELIVLMDKNKQKSIAVYLPNDEKNTNNYSNPITENIF